MNRLTDRNNFIDIENYNLAYIARRCDYVQIKKKLEYKEREILLMHLGGIIIECFVKDKIVKNNNIKKTRFNKYWYSESTFNYISSINNPKKEYLKEKATLINPNHDIRKGIKSINIISKYLIDANKNIDRCIDVIQTPFKEFDSDGNGYEKIEFIDLRYLSSDELPNIKDVFDNWEKSFRYLHKWLIDMD